MAKIKNILFICAGNTARSPAAEYLAKYYVKKYNLDLNIDSSGFFNAFVYMQPESRAYLDKKKIDHSGFTPKVISKALLEKQDLIITMEKSHSLEIIRNYPQVNNIDKKTFTLKEFNDYGDNPNIIDPYYTNHSIYQKVLKIIDENVEKMIIKLKKNKLEIKD